MEMYIICVAAVVATLTAKGYTVFRVERLRTDLVRSKREAQDMKTRLSEAFKRHAEKQRSVRSKEIRIAKLKKEIGMLEQQVRT